MKTLEDQLWNYIDGNATTEEQAAVKLLLLNDAAANKLYQQLLELNIHFNDMEIDEPSMSFTRNVMEQVALEVPPVALKTKIDKRIIMFIAFFFITTLVAVFGYAIATSNTELNVKLPAFDLQFNTDKFFNPTFLKIFLFADIVIALVYFDSVLRRKLNSGKKVS